MGRCPSCGASSFFSVFTRQCANCGRTVCNRCIPQWKGAVSLKTAMESQTQPALYDSVGFCSESCFNQFWERVFIFPVDYQIGTDSGGFEKKAIMLWNQAIANSFTKCNANVAPVLSRRANYAVQLHSGRFQAFPWLDASGKPVWMFEKFHTRAKTELAKNLEKCGRTQDSAKIYEDLHMYDKARELREKDRQIFVKKTDVSINLNALLQQVKDGGLVAIFRCPHCGGKLKINESTTVNSLRTCEHCGSEIESMDLADFLKTVLD
jgi:uncharacterized protein (DUF983 family)